MSGLATQRPAVTIDTGGIVTEQQTRVVYACPGHTAKLCRLGLTCAPCLMQRGEDITATPQASGQKAWCVLGQSWSVKHQRQGVYPKQICEIGTSVFCLPSSCLFPFFLLPTQASLMLSFKKGLKSGDQLPKSMPGTGITG